jgi:hypothetical protein
LTVRPKGEPENFMPQYDNWRRAAKVPVLIVNATTLNTGHNWRFTATWMGESPADIDTEIDSNDRLRRMYYAEAPQQYRRVRLGHAVAASASVPGLFEPLALPDLYPERVVQLIDGSFRDGQGTLALLEQDCNVILASDATGHIASRYGPAAGFLVTFVRAVGLLAASLREAKYQELNARRRSALLRGLMYVHLKKDIGIHTVDWIGCDSPTDAFGSGSDWKQDGLTGYGIRLPVQERLAEIRADFDSYTEAEAYALMTSGYRMTEQEFPKSVRGFPRHDGHHTAWRFLRIEGVMNRKVGAEAAHEDLMKLLRTAGKLQFKAWEVSPLLRASGALVGLAVLAGLAALAWNGQALNAESLAQGLKAFAIVLFVGTLATLLALCFSRRTLVDFAINLLMLMVGFPAALFRLLFTDKLYLRRGSLERLLRLAKSPPDG